MSGRFALTGLWLVLIVACSTEYSHGTDSGMMDGMGPTGGRTSTVSSSLASYDIDADMTMADINPGREAGAFVEYQAGGQWRVYVTCDSSLRGGGPCTWTVRAKPADISWSGPAADQLESSDQLAQDRNGPWLVALTTTDFDGFRFATRPGTTVRFDVILDNQAANGYLRWVSGGAVNMGASTNPVDLWPSTP
jgi:hypothetical protein